MSTVLTRNQPDAAQQNGSHSPIRRVRRLCQGLREGSQPVCET